MFRKLLFLLAFACSTLTVACGGGGGGSSDNSTPPATLELSGEITLTPAQIVLGGTLYANYSGNEKVTFQWRRNGTIIIDITGKELKPSAAGEYTVTVSLAGYIPKSSAPATVTDPVVVEDPDLNGTVNISPTSGVEVGDKLTASYTGSEAGTKIYTWTGTCVEGQTGATCTTTTAGTYKVTLNIDGFKPKDSANVTVSPIVNVPGDLAGTVSISPATAEVGDKLTASYTGSEAGNRAYTWTGTCIEGQTGATCTTTAAGAYKVTLNIEGYNPKDSAPVTVTDPVVILPGDLEGTVSISPATAEVGDILTASYDGDEGTGVYTWTGVCTDGQTGATCTTTTAGTYKVRLTIEGYNPKDSAPVTVTDPVVIVPGDLEGTVSISPATAEVGDILTASYDGSEGTGVYTWTGACADGQTGETCTTTTAGTYKVTLTIEGYNPKSSANVTVTDPIIIPEDLEGTVLISPSSPVLGFDVLTASYTGSEDGVEAYIWTGACEEDGTGATCTPTAAGTYSVTLNISGYNPKDSAPVTVAAPSDLSDVVYITPTNPVLGDTLTANYDGNEGIGVYTWIGTCEEGQTGTSCTPTGLGTYTVKLTIPRYNPKDSAAVTVVEPLPETLEGTVSVTPTSNVMVGDLLTASYNGGEAGTKVFTWAGTCEEGGTGIYCTPTKTGTYKATLNIDGYYPKASNGVVVFPQPIPFAGNVSIAVENDYPFVLVGDTLTASYDDTDATPTFTWSRSCEEGQNSAICTPTTTGTYAVTASAQGFISETEQISVVTPQPQTATVSIIATETPVYTRDTLTASYSEDDTGVTYTWHSANNIQQGSGKTFSTQFYGSFYVNAKKARYQDKKSATVTIVARPTLSANVSIAAEANPQFVIDGTVYTGATLKATYGGSEEVSYAWTRSYYPICSDSDTCITTQPGRYEVTISSGRYATKISNYITVTDDPLVWFKGPLSILSDYPADDTRVGDKLRANYLGDDSGGLSYAWYNTSGTKLSTNSIFTTTESGTMRLVVSKSGYHDIEKTYDVVEKPVLPKLTVTSANSYLVNGLLTASAYSGDETISYQWYHDNVAIDGATSSTYMPTAVGYYYVEISAPRTTTTASDPVGVKAVASQDPLLPGNVSFNETAFIGDTLKVTYVGDGSLTLTYKWYLNNVLIDGVTTATYKPAAGAVGTYRVEIGASGYASRTVELRVSGWVRAADYTTIFGEYGVQDIAYGNGVYVGIGSSDLGYSTDGITWQTTGESGAGNLAGIVFGDGVFVRIGWGAKYSTDGINWTQATGDDVLESVIGTHIAYGNNTFVAINGTNMVYSKDGGQTWTTNTSAFPPAASYKGIDYVNDRFLLVTNFGEIAYSTDGVTFTAATGTKQASALSGEGIFAYGNGRYILAYNDYIAYSDDPTAATWEPLKDIVGSSASKIHGITFGNGKFVLVSEALFGSDGNVAYSLDGLTWVDFPVGYSFEYNADIGYSILYDGSKFIAGGKNSGSTMSKIIYMVD